MHHTQHHQHIQRPRVVLAIALTVPMLGATATAQARPDPGSAVSVQTSQHFRTSDGCTLQRVDRQLVACDNLTGNNVPAPSWVPQR